MIFMSSYSVSEGRLVILVLNCPLLSRDLFEENFNIS